VISDLLYGLKANDKTSLIIAAAALITAAALASFVPARHAFRVDPMTAIRYE
jgi:ABC-type antimicrobial peptide transport system permease subunit